MTIADTWISSSPQQTADFGAALARLLTPGDVVGLSGPLGSGKTQLVKGLAAGLGVPADEPVISPTFVLMREYRGRRRLIHLDTYRLGDVEELDDLGLDELLAEPDVVLAIEWADRFPERLPAAAYRFELAHGPPARAQQRQIRLASGPRPLGDVLTILDA